MTDTTTDEGTTEDVPYEIEAHVPGTSFLPDARTRGSVWNLAQQIATTEFVPGSLRGKPAAIMAAMLTGREVGIGAMHSLRAIDVIDGRPSLSPELLHALALKAGHDVDVEESTRTGCTVAVRRTGWPPDRVRRVTFDEVDARMAGLVGDECRPADGHHVNDRTTSRGNPTCGCKMGYRTYPRAMYRARAVSEAARTYLPDVVERIGYTQEEMGGTPLPHDEAMGVVQDVAPDQAGRVGEDWDGEEDDAPGDVVDAEVVPDGDDTDDEPDEGQDPGGDTPPDAPDDDTPTSAPDPDPDPPAAQESAPAAPARTPDPGPPSEQEGTPAAAAHARADAAEAESLSGLYDRLNVTQVSEVIRHGQTDVEVGTTDEPREVTITGTPHDVWTLETARAKAGQSFRKTVKGALDAAGYLNRDTPPVADDEPAQDALPVEDDTPDPDTRREALREYKRMYRLAYDAGEGFASRMHSARLRLLGDGEDATFQTAPSDAVRDLIDAASKITAEAEVPF